MNLNQLTITRFIAAFVVVCFHFVYHPPVLFFPFDLPVVSRLLMNGDLAVPYFFILSGFVLTTVYSQPAKQNFSVKHFYRLRVLRLFPVYLLSILLFVPVFFQWEFPPLITILLNVSMIQGWFTDRTFNFAAWSLSAELFFYLLFPFLFRLITRTNTRIVWVLTLLLAGVYVLVTRLVSETYIFLPPPIRYFFHFYSGAVTAVFLLRYSTKYQVPSIGFACNTKFRPGSQCPQIQRNDNQRLYHYCFVLLLHRDTLSR
jgi:peptidoglycan/LPS O-acetylase OafA/YrhL